VTVPSCARMSMMHAAMAQQLSRCIVTGKLSLLSSNECSRLAGVQQALNSASKGVSVPGLTAHVAMCTGVPMVIVVLVISAIHRDRMVQVT